MKSPSTALAVALLAGLAVGAVGAWSFQRIGSNTPSDAAAAAAASSLNTVNAHNSSQRQTTSLILVPQLVGAEADAALDAYLALPVLSDKASAAEVQEKRIRLQALLTLLPDSHVERLVTAPEMSSGEAEAQLRQDAFEVWAERNAPAAARWAFSIPPDGVISSKERSAYVQQAVLAWARDDFDAAYAWANGLADISTGRALAIRLLGQLAVTDPHASVAIAAAAGDDAFRRLGQIAVFQAWSERDPAAALRTLAPLLLEQPSNSWMVQKKLAKWLAREPAAALDWALAQPAWDGNPPEPLLGQAGRFLIDDHQDVRPLLELLGRSEEASGRSALINNLFSIWIMKDYSSAVAWIDTVTDTAQRTELIVRALGYSNKEQPDDFIALTRQLPSAAQREATLSRYLSEWAETNPEAVLALLDRYQGPEFTAAARVVEETLIAGLAKTDASAAVARWEALPANASRVQTATSLASNWSQTDPAAASQWLARQFPEATKHNPQDSKLNDGLRKTTARWAQTDPLRFVEWALTLPAGDGRTIATAAFENSYVYWYFNENEPDPPPRAAYAAKLAQIKDPRIRDLALTEHLKNWGRGDAGAARAWIESNHALTPEAAANLLTRLETGR